MGKKVKGSSSQRVLPEGIVFPYDFGFVPSTKGSDGDPIDVLVLVDEPTFPGVFVGMLINRDSRS